MDDSDSATYLRLSIPSVQERDGFGYSPPKQKPTIFWIGCCDARVSEATVLPHEEIFVHRNIANQFDIIDGNAVACLAYAASLSTMKEIMVVGHTDCGGVLACYDAARGRPPPLHWALWHWLGPLLRVARLHINDTERQLIERNVRAQVANVRLTLDTLTSRDLKINGYVYDIARQTLEKVNSKLDV